MSELRITELDFDNIKTNLKNFLRTKPEFTDFDFDGSVMAVLLDVLAYNTHYNGFYSNSLANEAFIDSAQLRASVVSRAKELGYVPRSIQAAKAIVDLEVVADNSVAAQSLTEITLDRYKKFTTQIDGRQYEFVNLQPYTLKKVGTSFVAEGVEIYQGSVLNYAWLVDKTNPDQCFIIPNRDVDTSRLRVTIRNSTTDLLENEFYPAKSFSQIDETNAAYWHWEIEDGFYEVEFGDGVIGKTLNTNNVVRIDYLVSDGEAVNGAGNFSFAGAIQGFPDVRVNTISRAFGGAERESIAEIKFNAVRNYSAQNRAVTPDDYEALILSKLGIVDSVTVWGGEDATPTPQYGKVFISVNLKNDIPLTTSIKQQIVDILRPFMMLSIEPVVVEPNYVNLVLDVAVKYDPRKTTRSTNTLQSALISTVQEYDRINLNTFNKDFRHAELITELKTLDPSITSVLASYSVVASFVADVASGALREYTVSFANPIKEGTVSIEGFVHAGNNTSQTVYKIVDIAGELFLQRIESGIITIVETAYQNNRIGTIDYATGTLNFVANFTSTSDAENILKVVAVPESLDFDTSFNTILQVDFSSLNMAVSQE